MRYLYLFSFLLSAFISGILAGKFYYKITHPENFIFNPPLIPTKIYDINNNLIAELSYHKQRYIKLHNIPVFVQKAFILMEDKNFYNHSGIDITGIIRASFINLVNLGIVMGGSTITQQLAKLFFITRAGIKRKRTFSNKFKELLLAFSLERFFTKQKILELYLNNVYLASGCYGVEEASIFYFGKSVRNITIEEASLLASLTTAPEYYSPIKHPERAKARQKIVLTTLIENKILKNKDINKILDRFWKEHSFKKKRRQFVGVINDKAPWFTSIIIEKLLKIYPKNIIYGGGLRVYTTLDLELQKIAKKVLIKGLKQQDKISKPKSRYIKINPHIKIMIKAISEIFGIALSHKKKKDIYAYIKKNEIIGLNLIANIFSLPNLYDITKRYIEQNSLQNIIKVEGALIAIDVHTGFVKAVIGGREFKGYNSFNRATSAYRQVGSAFKPFVYGAGLYFRKITPATLIYDSPEVGIKSTGELWLPKNYERKYYGYITIRKALAMSINIASLRIAELVGIERIAEFTKKLLHFSDEESKRRIPIIPSLALGSIELTPLEIASAYSIIANYGKDVKPIFIRYITDVWGNIIYRYKPTEGKEIIDESTAYLLIDLMRGVVNGGTAYTSVRRKAKFSFDCAGKTGTTNDFKDAWFVGFTPDLVAAVWIGFDDRNFSLGYGQSGGVVAAPIWGKFMKLAVKQEKIFPKKGNISLVRICKYSGKLPSKYCEETYIEKFIKGTEPKEICSLCKENKALKIEKIIEKHKLHKKKDWIKKEVKQLEEEGIL